MVSHWRNMTNPTSRLTSIMKNHVEDAGMSTPEILAPCKLQEHWRKSKFVTDLAYRMRLSQKKKTKE